MPLTRSHAVTARIPVPHRPWWGLLALLATLATLATLAMTGCAPLPGEDVGATTQAVCTSSTLSASPQGAAPGTTVTWTATAGCAAGDTPEYEFWMLPPGGSWSIVQPYGSSSTYTWNTTGAAVGLYDFQVWARAVGSSSSWESYLGVSYQLGGSAPCTGGALSFSPAGSADPGTTVTLTGTATCGGTPQYEFWMLPPGGSWSIVQPYSASSTFTLNTTGFASGFYDFQVWVENQGSGASWETYQGLTYTLAPPCTGGALSFSPPGPSSPGATVTLTGSATCAAAAQYEVWMLPPGGSWSIVQPYSASSTYAWNTTGFAGGTYDFQVWVENQGATTSWETYQGQSYTLTGGAAPCTGGALSFDPSGVASVGTTVTLTGSATCGGTPQYQFWMQPPGGSFSVVQPYSASSTYAWNTTGLAAGVYEFQVWVENQGSTSSFETYQEVTYTLTNDPGCTNAQVAFNPPSPSAVGTMVTMTGSANCVGGGPEYEFTVASTVVQAYGPSNTFTWDTTGLAAGEWAVQVAVRPNPGALEAFANASYDLMSLTSPCTSLTVGMVTPNNPSVVASGAALLGSTVTMQAVANCLDVEYEFWMQPPSGGAYFVAQPYGSPNGATFVWDTTGQTEQGVYQQQARVRHVGSNVSWEAYGELPVGLALWSAAAPAPRAVDLGGWCVRMSDGTAQCCADSPGGPFVPTLTGVAALSGFCALLTDGTVTCMANNDSDSWTAVPGLSTVVELASCEGVIGGGQGGLNYSPQCHACALLSDGTVQCWGNNVYGQLGDGTITNRATPVTVVGLSGVAHLPSTLGSAHSCALLTDGTVRCWGFNGYGEVGDGTLTDRHAPTLVTGLSGVLGLELDLDQSCALVPGQVVRCWGGIGHGLEQFGPTAVADNALFGAVQIANGCGLLPNASVFCEGRAPSSAGTVLVSNGKEIASASFALGLDGSLYGGLAGGSLSEGTTRVPASAAVISCAPAGSAPVGTLVTATANSDHFGPVDYKFLVQPPGGSYAVAQDWSLSSTYAWSTTGLPTGVYSIQVWVRDTGSTANYESLQNLTYTLH